MVRNSCVERGAGDIDAAARAVGIGVHGSLKRIDRVFDL
jgi:hypothetical protein